MDLQSAIRLVEESPNYDEFSKIKKIFKDRIEDLKETDFTEKGICYYYLLRIVLRSHLMYETEECRTYLEGMDKEFRGQFEKYQKDFKKFDRNEIFDFFKLMERSYGSLEIIFRKKDFFEEEKYAYQQKMWYRQQKFWTQRRIWSWFEYAFLGATSSYGNSFIRWGLTAFVFAISMAGIYYLSDLSKTHESMRIVASASLSHWYDYVYFSVVTLTSLGIGDFVPRVLVDKMLVSAEVFFGFIMLGIFISLIQKKM
ncbi:MAG: hypothetical protein UT55_C0026G0011 [Candidatus Peregrinibacteria bacterium GW2011_GWE2_39_6]|nr:MAG: hypothetical protein UT36_C0001G0083 [Candidatus Peregrinibacteria bacterium GW2011_GWF2_39_17]KKR25881.1 MAG: hypothetical protein UT55_C0026G0011 [Candidatus Peregrinibacteria bacterium GW2011_GWE2_39_6]HCW32424.1 hypothetical protein [Candidatus Peregrinibacteria bacterium]